jgi:hypothetical protein
VQKRDKGCPKEIIVTSNLYKPIPVAARSKAYVCGRLVAGITGSNPARGMDVCLLCLYVVLSCVGRGLCDDLITRPAESYRVSCMCVITETPKRGPMFQVGNERKMNEIYIRRP